MLGSRDIERVSKSRTLRRVFHPIYAWRRDIAVFINFLGTWRNLSGYTREKQGWVHGKEVLRN